MLRFPKGVNDDVLDATAYQLKLANAPEGRIKQSYWDRIFEEEFYPKKKQFNKGK